MGFHGYDMTGTKLAAGDKLTNTNYDAGRTDSPKRFGGPGTCTRQKVIKIDRPSCHNESISSQIQRDGLHHEVCLTSRLQDGRKDDKGPTKKMTSDDHNDDGDQQMRQCET